MIDLVDVLERIQNAEKAWSSTESKILGKELAARSLSVFDWDSGAGESWGMIVSGSKASAYISMKYPLIMSDYSPAINDGQSAVVQVVQVSALDSEELRCEKVALEKVFGNISSPEGSFNFDRFSANDLWYATV